MKKLLLLLTALCSTVMVNAQTSDATKIEYESGKSLYFILDNSSHTASVTSYKDESYNSTNEYIGAVQVPATVTYSNETYSVTGIGNAAFEKCRGLTSISLQEGITSIGNDAFKDCSGLENTVVIPSSVTTIGDRAFYDCTNLPSVTIKGGSIGGSAFWNCTGLTSLSLQEGVTSIGTYAFHSCSGIVKGVVIPSSVTTIGNYAFDECTNLPSVTVKGGSIGDNAFSGCTGLTSLSLQEGVTSIGEYAFNSISGIEGNLIIPSTVTSVGSHAFFHLDKLSSVTVKGGSLGDYAFSGCTGLTSISLQKGVTNIGNFVFEYCSNVKGELAIPSTVKSIGNAAFSDCTGLTSISIPEGVTSIGNNAFYGCSGVEQDLVIPSTVRTIGDAAFSSCTGLTSVSISEGVTTIGDYAFDYCSGMKGSLDIPSTVTSIGNYAFLGCENFSSIYVFPSARPSLGDGAFENVEKNIPVYVPDTEVYDGWGGFKNIRLINFFKLNGEKYSIDEDGEIDELEFKDKDAFLSYRGFCVKDLSYTRDFGVTVGKWQCWYMPFDADMSVLSDAGMDAAEIAGILFDKDKNTVVAFNKMEEGSVLKANTPYVVRLNNNDSRVELTFRDAYVYKSEEESFTIQSAYDKFTFTGNYAPKHIDDCYTLNTSGEFMKMKSGVALSPMRFALTIAARTDGPYYNPPAAAKAIIKLAVLGEDGANAIHDAQFIMHNGDDTIYNLNGQKVNSIQSGHIYIVNGKKYVAK